MGKRRTTVSSEPTPVVTPAPAPVKESNHTWLYFLAVVAAVVLLFAVF